MIQQFDERNGRKEAVAKWFSVMDIPQAKKDKRVEVALDYAEIFILLFQLITEQDFERDECIEFLMERLVILAERETDVEDMAYINDWARSTAEEIVDETFDKYENEIEDITIEEENAEDKSSQETKEKTLNFKEYDVEIPEKDYPLSNFRATLIGIRCATTVMSFSDYLEAIEDGCTRKVWITENDDLVRPTHQEVDGLDLPINAYFNVGDSMMLFPGDSVNGAELKELLNCRCWLNCY